MTLRRLLGLVLILGLGSVVIAPAWHHEDEARLVVAHASHAGHGGGTHACNVLLKFGGSDKPCLICLSQRLLGHGWAWAAVQAARPHTVTVAVVLRTVRPVVFAPACPDARAPPLV